MPSVQGISPTPSIATPLVSISDIDDTGFHQVPNRHSYSVFRHSVPAEDMLRRLEQAAVTAANRPPEKLGK